MVGDGCCCCFVLFCFFFGGGVVGLSMGERASSGYRSTSLVKRAGAFDCEKRWVRVDGRVCG